MRFPVAFGNVWCLLAALWLWPQVTFDVGGADDGVHEATPAQVTPAEPRPVRVSDPAALKLPGFGIAPFSLRLRGARVAEPSELVRDRRADLRTQIRRLRVPRLNNEPPDARA